MRAWGARLLRNLADRIDDAGGPKITHLPFTARGAHKGRLERIALTKCERPPDHFCRSGGLSLRWVILGSNQ